jgi:hypothetical protein
VERLRKLRSEEVTEGSEIVGSSSAFESAE